jgi:hypothetical protein
MVLDALFEQSGVTASGTVTLEMPDEGVPIGGPMEPAVGNGGGDAGIPDESPPVGADPGAAGAGSEGGGGDSGGVCSVGIVGAGGSGLSGLLFAALGVVLRRRRATRNR